MAATMSSPWAKPGAWALDAEENEAELLQQQDGRAASAAASASEDSADFPSLAAAAAAKPKKKKGQTLSLQEFSTYGSPKPAESKGLTPDELMNLPTGPRQRSAEELDRNRLGGGFKSYGSNRYGDDSSRWGSSRGSDEGRKPGGGLGRDAVRESMPSRADEIDDWAAAKKSASVGGFDRERRERDRGGFFSSQSKADDADRWVSSKPEPPRRFGGFDRERRGGPRGGFESMSSGGGADSDNWGRKEDNGFGSPGSSNGRPRLVLQPRTLPVDAAKQETVKPKGSNPFGEARPREEVLKEKGQDWKEIEEKLDSMKIKEKEIKLEREGSFGKKLFGIGNGKSSFSEERTERSWRKPDSGADERPQSAEKIEERDNQTDES